MRECMLTQVRGKERGRGWESRRERICPAISYIWSHDLLIIEIKTCHFKLMLLSIQLIKLFLF